MVKGIPHTTRGKGAAICQLASDMLAASICWTGRKKTRICGDSAVRQAVLWSHCCRWDGSFATSSRRYGSHLVRSFAGVPHYRTCHLVVEQAVVSVQSQWAINGPSKARSSDFAVRPCWDRLCTACLWLALRRMLVFGAWHAARE